MTMPQLKPSPVDESSLRHALQRVEDRLRLQDQKRRKDEHHERTLKLAREFAARGIRQRQRDWERQNRKKNQEHPADQHDIPDIHTAGTSLKTVSNESGKVATMEAPQAATKHAGIETQRPGKKQSEIGKIVKKVIPLKETPAKQQLIEKQSSDSAQRPTVPIGAIASAPGKAQSKGLMRLMPIVAWLILGAGLIGAVLSWTTMSDVQANTFQMDAAGYNLLPMGLLLGFAYLATGVLGFAFFWVSSLIGNQLKEIRRLLFLQPLMGERSKQ